MRRASRIVLMSPYTVLFDREVKDHASGGMGVFGGYEHEHYKLDGESVLRLMRGLGVGGYSNDVKDFEPNLYKLPVTPGGSAFSEDHVLEGYEIESLHAEVEGPQLLHIQVRYAGYEEEENSLLQEVTYSGNFIVEWATS